MLIPDALPNELDQQVEWFHALASAASAGSLRIDASMRDALRRYLEVHLGGCPLSGEESELVDAIVRLRQNKFGWNRALMSAIIEADDASQEGRREEARRRLLGFSRECPWTLLARVARNQASAYSEVDKGRAGEGEANA